MLKVEHSLTQHPGFYVVLHVNSCSSKKEQNENAPSVRLFFITVHEHNSLNETTANVYQEYCKIIIMLNLSDSDGVFNIMFMRTVSLR